DHLEAKENVLKRPERYGVEEERTADHHEDERRDGPRHQPVDYFSDRHRSQGPTEQPQVEHHDKAEEKRHRPYMDRFDDRIGVLRLMEANAPWRIAQPSEESQKRHSDSVEFDPALPLTRSAKLFLLLPRGRQLIGSASSRRAEEQLLAVGEG